MATLAYILSHCAFCGKGLKENEGINGGVIYPEVWCSEQCRNAWFEKRNQNAYYN